MARADSLVPARDEYADLVFQGRAIHTPVEEPHVKVQPTNQVEVKSVDSSGAEAESTEDEMVVRRNITIDWFLPCDRPVQQQAQGRDQPPPAARARKRPCTTDQPPKRPEKTPLRIPPASTQAIVVIQEPTSGSRPIV